MKQNQNTSRLITIAFFIALEIILTRFLSINTPFLRIGFGFLPVAMLGILYGPLWAGAAYAVGDLLGIMMFPSGAFFPGFTISAFLTGLTFGFFLYNKPVTWKRVLMASSVVCLLINMCLDTLWLYILMDNAVIALIPARIFKSVVMLAIQVTLIPMVWNRLLSKIKLIQTA
ncbi:folate family ECF transporter S component [Anoxybacterium hadale]|uniref:Folate family ECF transporter S component n=1 Tax=Anoxybacterium hadale TaxID=3408580 RepID=A0ACD1AGK1_9FIRM|nr:folate family ECF transporter S component [Clostridiales bacterium]